MATNNNDLQVFWQPHFYGERFLHHTFPVDCLKEIIVLKDILQRVANQEFREKNDRKRIPANFNKNVSIDISAISEGSAVVSLVLAVALTTFPSEAFAAYESAKRTIIKVINQASNDEPITAMTQEKLRLFDKLGRGLRDDEYILLDKEQNGHQIIFNTGIRKKILDASGRHSEMTQNIALKGRIFDVNLDKKTYGFDSLYQGKITSPLPYDYQAEIATELVRSNEGGHILLEGIGVYKDGSLTEISEISNITTLEDIDVSVRLRELSLLKQGWLDGVNGIPPKASFTRRLDELFEKYYPSSIQLPYIYPTAEGGISLEWDDERYLEFSVEIDPETLTGSLYALKITEEEIVKTIQLSGNGWAQIEEMLSTEVKEG